MQGTIVGVLRGGPSKEHEVSLKTGHTILSNLPSERFSTRDFYIDKSGAWFERGRTIEPVRALQGVDVAFVGLHGEYGEDGQVQKFLEQVGVPYTGSDSIGSFIAMHKVLAKEKARELGILTPDFRFIEAEGDIDVFVTDVIRSFHQPVIIKPVRWGSSVGISIAGGYASVYGAVDELLKSGAQGVMVEELIRGREATAGVVQNMRGEELYALPPVEIIPPENDFFSYHAKYSGASRELCPSNFSHTITEDLMNLAKRMHSALGLRHYSRSDFIVGPRGIYYLETNTLPGLTTESLMPKSLAAVGILLPEFLTHVAHLALQ